MSTDPTDDRTVIAGGPVAAEPSGAWNDSALPLGTRLGEFEIVGLVGVGGFSIVYLAQDHSLGRRVALKEYMPQALAARGAGVTVGARSARQAETFEAGRRSFVNEARLLAQFDHPSLVKVYRFWEAHGTAYMVMPYYEGRTLKDALQAMPVPPDQAWLERLLGPLLDALATIHAAQVYHRDIAPDNIQLLSDDRPLLLDFGAARHVISGMTQALTVILKPGYAPIEQYAEVPDLKQGAWTDIYALAAVVYFAIAGKTPVPAVGRMITDSLEPLARLAEGRYATPFLQAVDAALAVRPADRPQGVAEFRERLGLPEHTATTGMPAAPAQAATPSARPPRTVRRPSGVMAWTGGAAAVAAGAAALYAWIGSGQAPQQPQAARDRPVNEPVAPRTPAEPVRPFNPLDEIDRIFEQRDRDHHVGVTMPRSRVVIDRDELVFDIASSKGGYVYILMVGTDREHFHLLFPNRIDGDNRIAADGRIELPRKSWSMVAAGPPGTNQFVAVVSETPRNFEAAGLVKTDPFAEFPLGAATRIARAAPGPDSPFVGTPICPADKPGCPSRYGAAVFSIEEAEAPKR